MLLHKKRDTQDCNNYRGISLLNVAYKILCKYVLTGIKVKAKQIIENYQGGIRIGNSTVDQIFVLRQIFQKAWKFDKELNVIFLNFKKPMPAIILYDCKYDKYSKKIPIS